MILLIDKKTSAKKAKQKIGALQKKRKFEAFNFLGKVKNWDGNGVEYQRRLRNEW